MVNVSRTTVVREAWTRGQALAVHSWIYALDDGLLRDLGTCVTSEDELAAGYEAALALDPACRVAWHLSGPWPILAPCL